MSMPRRIRNALEKHGALTTAGVHEVLRIAPAEVANVSEALTVMRRRGEVLTTRVDDDIVHALKPQYVPKPRGPRP